MLNEEVKKAFAEAMKYAKVVTVEDVKSKTTYIVAGDSPEDTDIRLSKIVKKALFTGCSVTYSGGVTEWIEDNVIKRNRTCTKKKPYVSIEVAEKMKEKLGMDLRIYHCPYCNFFHLTKKEKVN